MTARSRMSLGVLAAALLVLLAAVPVRADQAYDRVAVAYGQSNDRLAPCTFTTAQLEAALRGTPPVFRKTMPALQRAIQDAIGAHKRGECKGVRPEEGTTGGAAPGTVPRVTTTPGATTPAPAATPPATATAPVTPAPTTTTPAPATATPAQPAAASSGGGSDRTGLLVALIALGALLLAVLALWGTARSRGWDPAWVARARHAWGEAGFRTASTWAEFTDWLRLGR